MSRICEVCARAYNQAQSRSHSNIATKRRQLVNLQSVVIGGKKSRVCTRCVRTLAKAKAMAAAAKPKAAPKAKKVKKTKGKK
ncbi:MAG: L28 family ribosomal protein [Patescibacteria group bacterium]|nr:L28 family ribosomal protein [Patescibacteria group bacterium]